MINNYFKKFCFALNSISPNCRSIWLNWDWFYEYFHLGTVGSQLISQIDSLNQIILNNHSTHNFNTPHYA